MSEKSISIRRATPVDAPHIHDAHMRSIREVCAKDYTPHEIEAWGNRPYDPTLRLQAIQDQFVWVVEKDGMIEGFSQLNLSQDGGAKNARIMTLYLTPAVLGKGHGETLIKLMLDEAKKFGAPKVTLESTITSLGFYLKYGFQKLSEAISVQVNGRDIPCYPMEIKL